METNKLTKRNKKIEDNLSTYFDWVKGFEEKSIIYGLEDGAWVSSTGMTEKTCDDMLEYLTEIIGNYVPMSFSELEESSRVIAVKQYLRKFVMTPHDQDDHLEAYDNLLEDNKKLFNFYGYDLK